MSGSSKTTKRHGLLLNLPGAPNTPHTVFGWPGLYRPDVPQPVGGEGDAMSLDDARKRIKARDAQVAADRAAWEAFEAEQVASGLRDNGPLAFDPPECPVVLVEIGSAELEDAIAQHADDVAAARNAVTERTRELRLAQKPPAAEVEQVNDEAAAVAGKA